MFQNIITLATPFSDQVSRLLEPRKPGAARDSLMP